MKIRRNDTLIWTVFLAVAVTSFLAAAWQYPSGVRLVPLVVGIPTIFLLALLLLEAFFPSLMRWTGGSLGNLWARGAGAMVEFEERESFSSWSFVVRVLAWIGFFYVSSIFLGFYLMPPVFIFVFLVKEGKTRALPAFAASFIVTFGLYRGLAMLGIDLWPGSIVEVLPGILGGGIIPPV